MRLDKSLSGHLREEFIARHRDHFDEFFLPLLLVVGQKSHLHLVMHVEMKSKMDWTSTRINSNVTHEINQVNHEDTKIVCGVSHHNQQEESNRFCLLTQKMENVRLMLSFLPSHSPNHCRLAISSPESMSCRNVDTYRCRRHCDVLCYLADFICVVD